MGQVWEKGQEWQLALGSFEIMPRVKVEVSTISFNTAISACVKRQGWLPVRATWPLVPAGGTGGMHAANNYVLVNSGARAF